jgi:adenylate cyclase
VRLLRSRRLVHALIAAGVLLALAGLYGLENTGWAPPFLKHGEYWFRDNILTVRGRLTPLDNRLVFVGIDNASRTQTAEDVELFSDIPPDRLRALNLMTARWPWSYEVYARLCELLLGAGKARAVIFDIFMWQPDPGDKAFHDALQKFPDGIVLASEYNRQMVGQGRTALAWTLPSPTLLPDALPDDRGIGYVSLLSDFDGKIRRALYQGTLEHLAGEVQPKEGTKNAASSLAMRAAEKLGPVTLSQPFAPCLFRYTGPPGTFPVVPLFEIFTMWEKNFENGARFRDKVIVVGDSWTMLHDDHPTPFGRMPGAEIHLNAINALLHRAFLQELPPWTGYLLMALAVVAAWLLTVLVKKIWLRAVAFGLFVAAYLYSVTLIYNYADTIVLAFPPALAFGVAGLVSFVYDFTHETLEKLRIRRTLEAYVSKDVVREVLDNPESYLSKLGGQRENVALIVTDLRGFTTMSEEMDSQQLVAQLNEYLSLMVDDIFSRRGSVDKFIGDAILAVWGHVKSEGAAQDVTLAIEAAFLMKESLRRLNADWESRGLKTFQMGIGINFGEVIFGNIGSSRKMEPTVIGDAVNTASRLEGLTKDYGRDLLVGEAVADLVKDSFRLQFVDKVTMKGKTKPLRIYSVVSRSDATVEPQMAAYLEAYEQAQASYSAGSFTEARVLFENCLQYWPDDSLLQTYMQRCTTFLERPSEGVWTGVHVAEHK